MQEERLGLAAPEPTVRADQILERGDLPGDRVEAGQDHDVTDVVPAVQGKQVSARVRAEPGHRIGPSPPTGPAAVSTRHPARRGRPPHRAWPSAP